MLENGFEIVENFIPENDLAKIIASISDITYSSKTGGIRNAEKKYPIITQLASSQRLIQKASSYLNGPPSLVRAILFNKTLENNWFVGWHQDKTVAVSSHFEMSGWQSWSIKDGSHHVQPPLEVLDEMITFRINLDPATIENGCLKVLPKSHRLGVIPQELIPSHVNGKEPFVCEAKPGSAIIMRPHILHSSSKANLSNQRRVIHLEFSSYKLPPDISWA